MSKRREVLLAVKALVATAVPAADVRGMEADEAKPTRVGPNGLIIVRAGERGEPDVDLSPPTYWWEHRIPLELAGTQAVIDAMLAAIDASIAADRYLGGLCIYLEGQSPNEGETEIPGAAAMGWADTAIIASYSTTSPLG